MSTSLDPWHQALLEAGQQVREGDLSGAAQRLMAAMPAVPSAGMPAVPDMLEAMARVGLGRPAGGAGALPMLAGEHTEAAGSREYRLFLPPTQPTPAPLLVMLHGCHQDPDDFALGSAMNLQAAALGCAVLYPAQSRRAHAQGCWHWYEAEHQRRGQGEPSILAGMVHAVVVRHGLDPQRVWVAGLSAGAAMAANLGAAYPDLFTAIGLHSGLPTGSAHDLASGLAAMRDGVPRPASGEPGVAPGLPTIVFHGRDDVVVHPANGERAALMAAAAAGATHDERVRGRRDAGRAFVRRSWYRGDGQLVAEHWLVQRGPHAWSGGAMPGSHVDPTGPDASARMLRFFLEQPPRSG